MIALNFSNDAEKNVSLRDFKQFNIFEKGVPAGRIFPFFNTQKLLQFFFPYSDGTRENKFCMGCKTFPF